MLSLRWLAVISMFIAAVVFGAQAARGQAGAAPQATPAAKPLTMTVAGFGDGADIPAKYTQAGNQTSPAISWANTPGGAVTFFLHMHDMDVSRNKTTDDQLHWIVWNIPASATGLPEGLPMGAQLQNGAYQLSASGPVYRGPGAPANGPRHHYMFELYALDTKLDVQPGADAFETRASIMKAIQGHILGKAAWVGLFHRPQ